LYNLSALAPAGGYDLDLYLGIFPSEEWSFDGFPFTKL